MYVKWPCPYSCRRGAARLGVDCHPGATMTNNEKRGRVAAICLALPGAQGTDHGDHAIYRVRGKVFAYFLDNHHGDGIVSVCVKSELGENADRVRHEPERFYLPAHIGARGWFGLRLDRGRVKWPEVSEVVERSFRLSAPPALLKKLDGDGQAHAVRARARPRAGRPSSEGHA